MNSPIKGRLLHLVLISALLFCLTLSLFIMKRAEYEKRLAAEKRLELTVAERDGLKRELDRLKQQKQDLEAQWKELKAKAEKLAVELVKEKEKTEGVHSELEDKRSRVDILSKELERERQLHQDVSQRLEKVKGDYAELRAQIDGIMEAKRSLEVKIKDLLTGKREAVELEKIVVKGRGLPEGRILVVNKDFNFIVTNLGVTNGMVEGIRLLAYRNEKFLAELEVEKAYENMCAAAILPDYSDVSLKEGDAVVIK